MTIPTLDNAVRRLDEWNEGDETVEEGYTPDCRQFQVDLRTVLSAAEGQDDFDTSVVQQCELDLYNDR